MLLRLFTFCAIACSSYILFAQTLTTTQEENSPAEQVAAFAEAAMNTKVGTGECWDLAQFALNKAGAKRDGRYGFGRKIDTRTEAVQRGDIVQFSKVLVERRKGNSIQQETMAHHTAIVVEVLEPGRYTLAHQNFGPAGRKVGRYELLLTDVKRGTVTFFRPVY